MPDLKRTWVEIDLDALQHNYRAIRAHAGAAVRFLGVVKADAYGHGAVAVARLLQAWGAEYLAVSNLDEARELRNADVTLPILLLGHTPAAYTSQLIALNITQTVTDEAAAVAYEQEAARLGRTLRVHIKLDTGMSRLGFLCTPPHTEDSIAAVVRCCRLPHLEAEGVFTHFAVSDEDDEDAEAYTRTQLALFCRVIDCAAEQGVHFKLRHCANSGAVANYTAQTAFDMIRPGLLLYGYGDGADQLGLVPVMREKTVVNTIKEYDANTPVSYGRTFYTKRPTRMGVLPIGYGDGFMRCLSNRCSVMTPHGPAPLCGRICMDMCMIDLTDLPQVQAGDEIEIFGTQNALTTLAAQADTIPYEIICAVSKRVPRIYLRRNT